jgi:peptidoglycan/LPS O-acetylase OafA/YrhL
MAANFRDLRPSWLTAACHTIAKYSYGIYLFHIPVIWLVFFKLMFLPLAIRWVLLCVLMVLVPWLAYHLVEAPMVGIGRRLASRVRLPGVSLDERLQAAATTDRPEDVLSGMQSIRRTEP